MTKWTVFKLVAGMAIAAAIAGCGGSDDAPRTTAETTPAATTAAVATTAPTAAAPALQTLQVKAGERPGEYYFEPRDLTVKPGRISVTLENVGPRWPHTFYVRNLSGDGDLVRSEEAQVGETGTIEFAVSQAGTYEIYCSVRGHLDRGQKGTLAVQG